MVTSEYSNGQRILKEFMRCGFIYQNKLFPTETGTPQGGIISPTLANITLDGMERLIKEKYWSNAKGTIDVRNNKKKVHLVRYADDFVVTGTDIETLEEIRDLLKEFLAQRGLVLSEEKTKITSIQEGYDFLGWNFRKYRGKMIIKPSNKSVHKVRMTISNTIRNNKTSTQANLIYQLNQVMRGWAEYHHSVCSKEIFGKIDHTIWEMLWHWAKRRHPNKSKNWIVNRYWKIHKGRAWSFISNENVLFYMSDMPIVRHSQLRLQANPFLDTDYFEQRKRTIEMKRIRAMSSNKAAHIGYYAL